MFIMGLFGKKPGIDNLKTAEYFLKRAEGYLKHSKDSPPDVHSASINYRSARTFLDSASGGPNVTRYNALKKRADEVVRSIIDSLGSNVSYHLSDAERSMETGDRLRVLEQSNMELGRESDEHRKNIMEEIDRRDPEAAARRQENKEKDERTEAEVREFLSRSGIRRYSNVGYSGADAAITRAEQAIGAVEEVAKDAKSGDVQPSLGAAREIVRKMREDLESRAK
ncbi:MAG: hypothetical protein HY515_00885 [Candidatus Aenigmarchaeota archaeon]|nr:hypothetical protein [Candidatus Aenigmarchaeota archaeon]